MLSVKNLSGRLFTNINLEVEENQIVAIIGDNGSGKSTLARTISGYYIADSGSVNLVNKQINLLTQNPYLQFVGNTVFDELTYSFEQQNVNHQVIEQALNNCPFDLSRNLTDLSGGEAQRLLIYKAICQDAKLIILDETLSNLDIDNKIKILAQLKQSNKAVILITNNLNDCQYADKVYKLENNQLIETDNYKFELSSLQNNQDIKFVYQGYEFRKGLNVVSGASSVGKTRLITNLCFDLNEQYKINLIPQYPFEIITTKDGSHIDDSLVYEHADLINLPIEKLFQNIANLSTGELVKLLVLESIMFGSEVIVLDEAIEVLDVHSQKQVLDLLLKQFETIIIVSHNLYLFNDYEINQVEVK